MMGSKLFSFFLAQVTPHQESLDDLWVAKFDSIEAAQSALDQVEANPNLGRFMEASFFFDNKNKDQDQVQPTPSKALYISNIAQETSWRDLVQTLSQFEGFRVVMLGEFFLLFSSTPRVFVVVVFFLFSFRPVLLTLSSTGRCLQQSRPGLKKTRTFLRIVRDAHTRAGR